jgi:ferredoxin--NADP+ reductase
VPGVFTSQLWKTPIGGTLMQRGITGPFTVVDTWPGGQVDRRTLVLVGGGTGLAPYISYALEMKRLGTPRELVILHGASYLNELAYRELLLGLQEETRNAGRDAFRLRYVASISRPLAQENAGWDGETGRIEALLQPRDGGRSRIEEILDRDIVPEEFFCCACGYDGTVKATVEVLEPRGFRNLRQKREDGTYDMKLESYG